MNLDIVRMQCQLNVRFYFLTGKASGVKGSDGVYPEGSINYMVDQKLQELAEGLKQFAGEEAKEEKRSSKKT